MLKIINSTLLQILLFKMAQKRLETNPSSASRKERTEIHEVSGDEQRIANHELRPTCDCQPLLHRQKQCPNRTISKTECQLDRLKNQGYYIIYIMYKKNRLSIQLFEEVTYSDKIWSQRERFLPQIINEDLQ